MSVQWTPVYVGVGSNLAVPLLQVTRGLNELATLEKTHLIMQSSLYRNKPMGPQDQPEYVNAVAALLTQLDSLHLLRALKALEKSLGKQQPVQRWGPRLIDFDLLMYGEQRLQTEELTLPHPGIAERNFVLLPLAEIAPEVVVPGIGRVKTLAARASSDGIVRVSAP